MSEATATAADAAGEQTAAATAQAAPTEGTQAATETKGGPARGADGKFAKASDDAPKTDDAGKGEIDWRSLISEERRKHAERFTSLDALVDGHAELRKQVAAAIMRPGKDASEEERAKYVATLRRELGIPEKIDDYQLAVPEHFGEDDKATLKEFVRVAHAEGVPPAALGKMFEMVQTITDAHAAALLQQRANEVAEAEVALRRKWGRDYEPNLAYARAARDAYLDPLGEAVLEMTGNDLAKTLGSKKLGDHPSFLEAFARIGRETNSSIAVFQASNEGQDLRAKAEEMMKDPRYWRDKDPAWCEQVSKLWQRLSGEASAA